MPVLAIRRNLPEVSLTDLEKRGFQWIFLDVDNTLLPPASREIPAAHLRWLREAQARGFRVVLVSNTLRGRLSRLARQLDLPALIGWKPLPFALLAFLRRHRVPRHRAVVIGDQVLTDVLCARLAGLPVILLEPLTSREFVLTRWFSRPADRWLRRRWKIAS